MGIVIIHDRSKKLYRSEIGTQLLHVYRPPTRILLPFHLPQSLEFRDIMDIALHPLLLSREMYH